MFFKLKFSAVSRAAKTKKFLLVDIYAVQTN